MEKSGIGIFRAKDQFIEAVLYDGSTDSAKRMEAFAPGKFTFEHNSDAGYVLFKDHENDPVILLKGDYIVNLEGHFVVINEFIFNSLFFKPQMDHN